MAQVTTNTEINTINILQEATSVNNTDLFLLQRGSQTLKLQKSNLTLPVGNLEQISDHTVLGNISGGPSIPYEIDILNSSDSDSNRDDALVTEKRIKDWVNLQQDSIGKIYHVNAVQASQGYYLTTAVNSSSNVFPTTAVKTYAMSIYPNLNPGDKVIVVWGYRSYMSSNGTVYSFDYATTIYQVNTNVNWSVVTNTQL